MVNDYKIPIQKLAPTASDSGHCEQLLCAHLCANLFWGGKVNHQLHMAWGMKKRQRSWADLFQRTAVFVFVQVVILPKYQQIPVGSKT